jgi:hypothetical protein
MMADLTRRYNQLGTRVKREEKQERMRWKTISKFNKQASRVIHCHHSRFLLGEEGIPISTPFPVLKNQKRTQTKHENPTEPEKVSQREFELAFSTPTHAIPTHLPETLQSYKEGNRKVQST